MRIPYVIDNQTHLMADVLNEILASVKGGVKVYRWGGAIVYHLS